MRKNKTIEHLELLWGCFRGGVVLSIAWLFKHIIMTLCHAPFIYLHMGGVIPVIVSALLFWLPRMVVLVPLLVVYCK